MNQQQVLLALALNEAGVALKVDKFDERLTIQKAVYLLQELGVHIGYRYQWYLHGPYSTGLANDAFLLTGRADEVSSELPRWQLDDNSRQRIAAVRKLFSGESLSVIAKHLELLASILFLIRTGQAKHSDPKRISEILNINSKPFNEAEVASALSELERYGFAF